MTTTGCHGCDKQIEWKTGGDGRKKRFNPDGSSHYCKDCQYCERKIEWRDNQYVNTTDLKKHQCDEYFDAQKHDIKEIEQTGKLLQTPQPPAPRVTATATKTAYEIQQDKRSQDIQTAHNENIETQKITQEIAKNLGITLGELVVAINENTRRLEQLTDAIAQR